MLDKIMLMLFCLYFYYDIFYRGRYEKRQACSKSSSLTA